MLLLYIEHISHSSYLHITYTQFYIRSMYACFTALITASYFTRSWSVMCSVNVVSVCIVFNVYVILATPSGMSGVNINKLKSFTDDNIFWTMLSMKVPSHSHSKILEYLNWEMVRNGENDERYNMQKHLANRKLIYRDKNKRQFEQVEKQKW